MRNLVFTIFLLTTSLSAQTKMDANEATVLQKKVKARADNTTTITSDFIQYKHLDFLSNDIESKGKMAFMAPNKVKWAYTTPFTYSILFKNQTLYINDDGDKSNMDVGGNKLFEQLNHLIASSIRGDMFNAEEFNISYFTKDGKSLVHFMPKDEQFSEFIKAFHITFNANGDVEQVKMLEPTGDYTKIIFSNRIVNPNLSDADFAH